MKERVTNWMDNLPITYLDEIDRAERLRRERTKTARGQSLWKKGCRRGWAAAACCAVLLGVVMNREPLMLKANELFLKARIYLDGPETFFDGEMKPVALTLPGDMERIWSQTERENAHTSTQSYEETGLRKIYHSLGALQEELGISVLSEELQDLAGEELWLTYYDTSADKEAIIDMELRISGQEEPAYLEINLILGEKESSYVDIGIPMSQISSAENVRTTESKKTYLSFSSRRPHYQMLSAEEETTDEAFLIYHQARKMLTPGYDREALFFRNGMRYYLYGIETEETAEALAEMFLDDN